MLSYLIWKQASLFTVHPSGICTFFFEKECVSWLNCPDNLNQLFGRGIPPPVPEGDNSTPTGGIPHPYRRGIPPLLSEGHNLQWVRHTILGGDQFPSHLLLGNRDARRNNQRSVNVGRGGEGGRVGMMACCMRDESSGLELLMYVTVWTFFFIFPLCFVSLFQCFGVLSWQFSW